MCIGTQPDEEAGSLAQRYDEAFKNCEDIITPYQLEGTDSGWHLYIIQILNHDRKEAFEKLREQGIGVNVHYIPVYKHPYYQEHGYGGVYRENAENLYKNMLSLPLYPLLTDEQQDNVIQAVKLILR